MKVLKKSFALRSHLPQITCLSLLNSVHPSFMAWTKSRQILSQNVKCVPTSPIPNRIGPIPHEHSLYCLHSCHHSGCLSSKENWSLSSAYSIPVIASPSPSKHFLQTSSKGFWTLWAHRVTPITLLFWYQFFWLVNFLSMWQNQKRFVVAHSFRSFS